MGKNQIKQKNNVEFIKPTNRMFVVNTVKNGTLRKDELNEDITSQLHRLVVITGGRANGHTCGDEGHSEYIPQRTNPGGKSIKSTE